MCCISRPRNRTLTSTLSLCSRNLRAWLTLVSTSCSPVLGRTRISLSFCWCDFGLAALARLLVAELAVVHDLADRRPFVGGDLDQVEAGLAGHLQGLGGRDDAELLAVGADQADGADADLFVDAGAAAVARARGVAVERWDASSPWSWGTRTRPAHAGRVTFSINNAYPDFRALSTGEGKIYNRVRPALTPPVRPRLGGVGLRVVLRPVRVVGRQGVRYSSLAGTSYQAPSPKSTSALPAQFTVTTRPTFPSNRFSSGRSARAVTSRSVQTPSALRPRPNRTWACPALT